MPRLSGAEASALVYLAEFPHADDRDSVLDRLGDDARKVAEVLIGKAEHDEKVTACAEAIRKWADRKNSDLR